MYAQNSFLSQTDDLDDYELIIDPPLPPHSSAPPVTQADQETTKDEYWTGGHESDLVDSEEDPDDAPEAAARNIQPDQLDSVHANIKAKKKQKKGDELNYMMYSL